MIGIIYEDDEIIVVDKPSGMTVNRAETEKSETVQDWAEKRLGISGAEVAPPGRGSPRQNIEEEFRSRGGVVHRLDKETSGILLTAKNPQSFLFLKNQFKNREVEKVYIALTHGEIKPEKGSINVPLGRLPYNRTRFGVLAGGREARTDYKVLNYYKLEKIKLTYLELKPKTGRTHQIRVHLKHLGHPIFADALYAGRKTARSDRKVLPRLFLHAGKITFTHPVSLQQITFESPLPKDLQNFLSTLIKSNDLNH